MATHPSILAWRVSRSEEPGGLPGFKELDTTEVTEQACVCVHLCSCFTVNLGRPHPFSSFISNSAWAKQWASGYRSTDRSLLNSWTLFYTLGKFPVASELMFTKYC